MTNEEKGKALETINETIRSVQGLKQPNGEFHYSIDESIKQIVAAAAKLSVELANPPIVVNPETLKDL